MNSLSIELLKEILEETELPRKEIIKKEKEMDMLFTNVQQLVKQKIDFDTLSFAKSKLNNFLTQ